MARPLSWLALAIALATSLNVAWQWDALLRDVRIAREDAHREAPQ